MPISKEREDARPRRQNIGKAAQILSAALTVFLEEGFGAASMDAIARVAGVSKATLYSHFDGKEALFARVVADEWNRHWQDRPEPSTTADDPVAALTEFGHGYMELLLHPVALAIYRITMGEARRFPDLGRLFFEAGPARVRDGLTRVLADLEGCRALRVDDRRLAAEQFLGLMQTPLYLRSLLDIKDGLGADDVDRIVGSAVAVFVRAYGTKEWEANR